jgi:hypothetical protein
MRRVLGPVLIVMILALALPVAATENANYKDKFDSIGWSGSNGSLPWSGPWQEIGDGSSNDEKQGNVRVVSSGNCASGNCMRFSALTTLLGPIGATRPADTSLFEESELCFDLKATAALIGSELLVQVNAGEGWVTVAEYELGAAQTDHPTIDISDYRSENFSVRFQFNGLLLSSEVFIDNVEITGELVETTTTTTAPTTTSTTEGSDEPSTTTTTKPDSPTTSTTVRATTTTRPSNTPGGPVDDITTSTTVDPTTTTTDVTEDDDGNDATLIAGGGGGSDDGVPPGSDGSPEGSGIRQTARGLQADFDAGLYGDVSAISPITGVDYQARFSMAVEIIEASWAWIVLLALVIAWSIVSGMDRRKTQLAR